MTTLISSEDVSTKTIIPYKDMEKDFQRYWDDIDDFILATTNGEFKQLNKHYKRTAINFWLAKLAEKWQPILDVTPQRINNDIRAKKDAQDDTFVSHLTLQEALQYYGTGAKWLIPNLLMLNGVMYILAGEPKVGKSILVNFLIYAVAVSGNFMGYPCKTGKVMYLQLEESLDTMGERLFYAGFGNLIDENTSLAVNFRPDLVEIYRDFGVANGGCDWLSDKIQELQPTLVIIDTLRASTQDSDASENTNEFGKLVAELQRVFVRTNTCGLVVHHMSKQSGKSKDASLVDRLSGHTSISSNSAGIIGLSNEEDKATNSSFLRLRTLPRSGTSIRIDYRMKTNPEGLWELIKLDEDTPIANGHTSKIILLLGTNPDVKYTQEEVRDYLKLQVKSSYSDLDFNRSIQYLTTTQIITKEFARGRFRYYMPSESAWMVAPQELSGIVSQSILDANSMLRCRSRKEVKELIDSWSKERQIAAYNELDGATKENFKAKLYNLDYDIGDIVLYKEVEHKVLESHVPQDETRLRLGSISYTLEGIEETVNETELSPTEQVEKPLKKEESIDLDEDLKLGDQAIDEQTPDTIF